MASESWEPPEPLTPLDERTVDADPMVQFGRWYDAAVDATGDRAAAMTISTVSADGRPSARVVLLRGVDTRGFVFFTNYESHKGRDLANNPAAAAMFYWPQLDAQVRVDGSAVRVDAAESDAYFAGRPRGHQIGAWASHQSDAVASRAALLAEVRAVEARFPGTVPRPPHWGGYRLVPDRIEFWRNRADRVHDRVVYARTGAVWSIGRISP